MIPKNILNYVSLISMIFLFNACDIIDSSSDLLNCDIPIYNLFISNEDYGQLVANAFSDLKIKGRIEIESKSYNVKIEYHGFSSRSHAKKNYGVEFDFYDSILNCKKVVLSGQATDPSYIRSYLASKMFLDAGIPTFKILPVAFYINNIYQGLYYIIEAINASFFYSRNIELSELYKAINGLAFFDDANFSDLRIGFEKKIPKDDNYTSLENLILKFNSLPDEIFVAEMEKIFDSDRYLKYMAISVLICNWDGVQHNFYLYTNTGTNKFNFLPWDLDYTFRNETSRTEFPGTNDLLNRLLEFPKYRTVYKNLFKEYLNSFFSQEYVSQIANELKVKLGNSYTEDPLVKANNFNYDSEIELIKSFVQIKRANVIQQLENFN